MNNYIIKAIFLITISSIVFGNQDFSLSISKAKRLEALRSKQILVVMWGWPLEEMAREAKKFGYEVVNSPHGNDIKKIKEEVKIWSKYGFKMIARPAIEVSDPFDIKDINKGIDKLNEIIDFYNTRENVIAIVISWGLFGEGGFPWDYEFTDKAKESFNKHMHTPGQELPVYPKKGVPGSKRWIKWIEFRSETLSNFRRAYIKAAQKRTDKLIGTWSEVYPTEHYTLNMGEAPGADFLFYDLSFGDVTCNQPIAFGETHGNMQHYKTFEEWKRHEIPLMAKAAGEGVVPIAFQFPMRRGHQVNFLSKTNVLIDNIEDEYSLRIGKEINKLVDTINKKQSSPEVGLVYQSFAAAGLPGGGESKDIPGSVKVLPFYENVSTKQIEGILHQMGVKYKAIPYEWLKYKDLSQYKVLIIPDPVYMPSKIKSNLKTANRIIMFGEYMLAHRQPKNSKGNYLTREGFTSVTKTERGYIKYFKAMSAPLKCTVNENRWMRGILIPSEKNYPSDQMFIFKPMNRNYKTLLKVGNFPIVISEDDWKRTYFTNRFANHCWHSDSDWLEKILFRFLKNYLSDSSVNIRVKTNSLVRVNRSRYYGSYGLTGNIAWNTTDQDLTIRLNNDQNTEIPANGWTKVNLK